MMRTSVLCSALSRSALVLGLLGFALPLSHAQEAGDGKAAQASKLPEGWQGALEWRPVGPANMSGRITEVAVHPTDDNIWWAATAGSGLVKTVNGGITFEHQFTHEAVSSVGSLAVSPSEPDTLWLGTGEGNPRNSVSWGNGIYKSTDSGETWKHMGLKGSYQIGDIVVHPADANVVYVGVLGRLWGPSPERGLYRTSDGGETWEQVLFIDERTGVIDIEMHPQDPNVMLVATYERQRDEFDTNDPAKKLGPGSGLWRTEDGGKTFDEVTQGLPSTTLGRIGLDWYVADPNVVYMVLESDRISQEPEDAAWAGIEATSADVGARIQKITEDSPAARAGLEVDDIVMAVDGELVHSYTGFLNAIRSHLAGETVSLDISRDRKGQTIELTFERRPQAEEDKGEDAEPEPRRPHSAYLGGQRENVQRQQGPDGHEYGGIYRSADAGRSWTRINSLNPRPMYFSEIRVDPSDESYIYVLGVSLHRSVDGGETFTGDGGRGGVHVDHHALWIDPTDGRNMILGNDGGVYVTRDRMQNWEHLNKFDIGQFYHVTTDSQLDYRVYGGLQDNGTWGGPVRSATGGGTSNSDWMRIGGGDGFVCRVDAEDPDQIYYESQNGGLGTRNLRTGQRGFLRPRAPRGKSYRWNWRTPFILSSFNSRVWYTAGNHVFRSWNRGSDPQRISPDITRTKRGSATALAESPRSSNELWVGTDDGALWSTEDGGTQWRDHFEGREVEAEEDEPVHAPVAAEAAVAAEAVAAGVQLAVDEQGPDLADAAPAALAVFTATEPVSDKTWSGSWKGTVKGGSLKDGGTEVKIELSTRESGERGGSWNSELGKGQVRNVDLNEDSGELSFTVRTSEAEIRFEGTLKGDELKGTLQLAGGLVQAELSARRLSQGATTAPAPPKKAEPEQGRELLPKAADSKEIAEVTEEAEAEEQELEASPRNEGTSLTELVPGPYRISEIACSRFADRRVYVAFDGHRNDDDLPYLFVTEDGGDSWSDLGGNLPREAGSVRTVEEDRVQEDLLWVGTEFGVYVSLDRGQTWEHLNDNLPTVAVHALAQHPSVDHVVAGTHGRSLWVLDATLLRQMSEQNLEREAFLFDAADIVQWRTEPSRGQDGMQRFEGSRGSSQLTAAYHLGQRARRVTFRVLDASGEVLKELETGRDAGLHTASWDLRLPPPEGSRWRFGRRVSPGEYTLELEVDGTRTTETFEVLLDPSESDAQYLEYEYQGLIVEALHGEEESEQ